LIAWAVKRNARLLSRRMDDMDARIMAEQIADYLRLCGVRAFKDDPTKLHATAHEQP
jgi:hypothetical protein